MELIVGVHTIQVDCVLVFEKNDFFTNIKIETRKILTVRNRRQE